MKLYTTKTIYLLRFIRFYGQTHNRLIYTRVYISIKIYVQGNWGSQGVGTGNWGSRG